ncbi:MAG: type I phosphomannose isomerase catalytic subunit [Patescibacteria group bacterium]|jgi:mannose-6-phosphate isomerase
MRTSLLYPLLFHRDGMTQSYPWGGERLKPLMSQYPACEPLAEIWAISDRPEDDRVSIVANGPLAGTSLRDLLAAHDAEILGSVPSSNGKFPLLVKLLDAKERLSLQVHPPTSSANKLGGEPKTECWYFLNGTKPESQIITGLKSNITREIFNATAAAYELESILHTNPVKPGDCMFLPSGRLHAIDAGCLLIEIQQNSNTTYRVYDWGRVDTKTGQPRTLHVSEALASINFSDVKPGLQQPTLRMEAGNAVQTLVDCPLFTLEHWQGNATATHAPDRSFELLIALTPLSLESNGEYLDLQSLDVVLVPAAVRSYRTLGDSTYLRTFVRA